MNQANPAQIVAYVHALDHLFFSWTSKLANAPYPVETNTEYGRVWVIDGEEELKNSIIL